jgi:hypothetical protein
MARNRVIYQSEALFTSPNATGAHFTATAVLTGMGPTGDAVTSRASTPPSATAPNGTTQLGNKVGLYQLATPIGLANDPYHLNSENNDGQAVARAAYVPDYTDTISAADLRKLDIQNIFEAVSSTIQDDLVNGVGGFKTPLVGQTLLANYNPICSSTSANAGLRAGANKTGNFGFYTNKTQWDAALSGYYHQDTQNPDPTHASSKNSYGIGVLLQPFYGDYENLVRQLHRVQSANYNFTVNRTDVNVFGQLARIDSIALEPPTVNLDFTYYPTDGFNERALNFYVKHDNSDPAVTVDSNRNVSKNSATPHLDPANVAGQNFFILTTPENTDAVNTTTDNSNKSVIGLGNGFLSDYTFEASVGSFPTVSSTIELYNAKSDIGTTGITIPGVDTVDGTSVKNVNYTLGHAPANRDNDVKGANATTGDFGETTLTVLRPGDISLTFPDELGLISKLNGEGSFHVQSISLSLPLSRTPIERLGSRFAFTRPVDLPITATMSVSALLADIEEGNLATLIDDCDTYDVTVAIKGTQCGTTDKINAFKFQFKGAKLDSESISSDIGSNKTVDLTWTTQLGGIEDIANGIFFEAANNNTLVEHYRIPNR